MDAQKNKIISTSVNLNSLAKTHYFQLKNFIKKHSQSKSDVDDLLQQTFLEAMESQHNFQGKSKPETWLFGIAFNLVRNNNRKRYRRPSFEEFEEHKYPLINHKSCPIRITETQLALDNVGRAYSKLPDCMQSLISQVCEQEKTYAEIASSFDVPIGTIRSRLSRVRAKLKKTAKLLEIS